MPIAPILDKIRKDIEIERKNSLLAARYVTLLAACKGQSDAVIREAIKSGITDFGENRVQEAEEKWVELRRENANVRLHLIGPLQSNKAKQAVALFDVIQTIDRIKVADALAEAMGKADKKIPCYVQVNTGSEPQKAGVLPEEADALIDYCKTQLSLPVAGLMCIPPAAQLPAPHFALLREIALRHGLSGLSMGMSDDYKTAVQMGATCVRIGRALFGERH